jgi:hypothetical protein
MANIANVAKARASCLRFFEKKYKSEQVLQDCSSPSAPPRLLVTLDFSLAFGAGIREQRASQIRSGATQIQFRASQNRS